MKKRGNEFEKEESGITREGLEAGKEKETCN